MTYEKSNKKLKFFFQEILFSSKNVSVIYVYYLSLAHIALAKNVGPRFVAFV